MRILKLWLRSFFNLTVTIGVVFFGTYSHAQKTDLSENLGDHSKVLTQGEKAETAKLKVVSVEESRKFALKKNDRIAGYPTTEPTSLLGNKKSNDFAMLLLDHNNFIEVRQRCKNKYFTGVRFSNNNQVVEVAVGTPCNQVLVVYQDKGEAKWWGGTLNQEAMKRAKKLLCIEQ